MEMCECADYGCADYNCADMQLYSYTEVQMRRYADNSIWFRRLIIATFSNYQIFKSSN